MSEELIQKNLVEAPEKMGDWNFYNIGATTLKALKGAKIIPDRDYDEYETKKPDALIVKKPLVIAAIEYKVPAQLRTDKQIEKAIEQELGTAQVLQAKVKYILLLTARKVSGSIPQMVMRFCRKTAVKSRLILIRTVQSVLF